MLRTVMRRPWPVAAAIRLQRDDTRFQRARTPLTGNGRAPGFQLTTVRIIDIGSVS
jgi:hypothetical protein